MQDCLRDVLFEKKRKRGKCDVCMPKCSISESNWVVSQSYSKISVHIFPNGIKCVNSAYFICYKTVLFGALEIISFNFAQTTCPFICWVVLCCRCYLKWILRLNTFRGKNYFRYGDNHNCVCSSRRTCLGLPQNIRIPKLPIRT